MSVKSIFSFCLVALLQSAAWGALNLPPVSFADTETTTNVVLNAGPDGVERISLELECLTTPTNNVQAAFGVDANRDGELQLGETSFVVGWDCGAWFVQRGCDGERVESPSAMTNSAGRLVFTMKAAAAGVRRRVEATADDSPVFGVFAAEAPPWLRLHGLDMVRLTGRGLEAQGESFAVRTLRDAIIIRFR